MPPRLKHKTPAVVLKEGKFIRFLRHDGWEYVERNNCRGIVIVLALTDEDKVILIDQYRAPVRKHVIEFPAGLISDEPRYHKESIASAAKRELLEETGYQARRIVKLLAGPVSSGFTADIVTVVRAYGLRKVARGGGDHTENIVVHEVPLAKAEHWLKQMSRKGYLIEPKVYMGLFFLTRPKR
ncbi:MAG: NUDIX hydrolase [Candidatus Omnitrophica bacterium]|nr:NUDIX hydrolase [Candidatus Omnitrophota bacterium]